MTLVSLLRLGAHLVCLTLSCLAVPGQAADLPSGWIRLFDGQTLFGWQQVGGEADWRIVDETIQATNGAPGFLMTTSDFGDYLLHVEFRAAPQTNSGVFLRTPLHNTRPADACYELNIAPPENPFPTGSFVERKKIVLDPQATSAWDGKWHAYDVKAVGGKFLVELDGQRVLEYDDPQPVRRGRIALQFREGPIAFRQVRLKPLGLQPLFNGRDLAGWNLDRAGASEFTVTNLGELRVVNGSGQLESEGRFGDFVLQLECRVDGDQLNSGIFFRCIPGDKMMGYESQIHNGIRDGDPTQPVDCGTGGIFRRQNARRVLARDHEWFSKTLVADGAHFAVWVNGTQVTDWTDDRPEDENPRRGLRLAPGTLAIQGHDPTTDLRFREMRIGELRR